MPFLWHRWRWHRRRRRSCYVPYLCETKRRRRSCSAFLWRWHHLRRWRSVPVCCVPFLFGGGGIIFGVSLFFTFGTAAASVAVASSSARRRRSVPVASSSENRHGENGTAFLFRICLNCFLNMFAHVYGKNAYHYGACAWIWKDLILNLFRFRFSLMLWICSPRQNYRRFVCANNLAKNACFSNLAASFCKFFRTSKQERRRRHRWRRSVPVASSSARRRRFFVFVFLYIGTAAASSSAVVFLWHRWRWRSVPVCCVPFFIVCGGIGIGGGGGIFAAACGEAAPTARQQRGAGCNYLIIKILRKKSTLEIK